ncbi:MAG: SdrD B-like domain-containing protein [Clostridia bacterium]|nr:SdrD B-like domain-containing protein [Clostridia bacterium]
MSRKIFKLIIVVLLLALITMPNFIYVGIGLVSYAESSTATSHQNVEFDAQLKQGDILSISINVLKEGYFKGEITLENSNFIFDTTQTNQYINKIEANKIYLNQINVGTNAQIDLNIKPMQNDSFDIGLLNVVSKLNISGVYRDSEERDINITGTRDVEFKYTEDNTDESIESTTKVITNKVIKVSGEDKRVVQLEMNLGLKENNYPIKEIEVNMDVPSINGKYPKVIRKYDFATMKRSEGEYKYDGEQSRVTVKFYNEPDENNKVRWIKQGNEKVVFTFIYDEDAKDATLDDVQYPSSNNLINGDENIGLPVVKVTLYDGKELNKVEKMTRDVMSEIKEEIVRVNTTNSEDIIYKGKLYAGIDRQYESKTSIAVNLANAENYIDIKESSDNTVFNKTVINKDSFDKIFGENGQITILNEKSEVLATIDNKTEADENKNIVIDYTGKEPSTLEIKATTPVKEGNIEINNVKTIKAENSLFKDISELNTSVTYEYISGENKEASSVIKLEETKTEATIKSSITNFSTLSTSDNVQLMINLLSNSEENDLFKNPNIDVIIPKIFNVNIKNITLLNYQDEFKLSYNVSNENEDTAIHISMEGEQKSFANNADKGVNIIIVADISASNILPSQNSELVMNYTNGNKEGEQFKTTVPVRLNSKEGTLIVNKISGYKDGEVTENLENEKILELEKNSEEKLLKNEVYVINNNNQSMKDISFIIRFPGKTNESTFENTMKSINIEGISADNIIFSYSENIDEARNDKGWISYDEIKEKNVPIRSIMITFENGEIFDAEVVKLTYNYSIQKDLKETDYSFNKVDLYYTTNGIDNYISSKYTFVLKEEDEKEEIEREIQEKNSNQDESDKSNIVYEGNGLKLEQKATSANETITSDNIVTEGQGIKYTISITNLKNQEIENLKIIATNNNAIYFNKVKEIEKVFDKDEEIERYKEDPSLKSMELDIGNLKAGETKIIDYQIAVSEVNDNNQMLTGKIKIVGNGLDEQEIDMQSNKIVKGSLKLNLEFAYDENVYIGAGDGFPLILTVKNISEQNLNNVKVTLPLSDKLTFSTKYIDADYKDAEFTESNKDGIVFNIPLIESGKDAKIGIKLIVNDIPNNNVKEDISQYFVATINNRDYISNNIEKTVYNNAKHLEVKLSSNIKGNTVKNGQNIIYYIDVQNNENEELKGILTDEIPYELVLNNIKKVSEAGEEEINLDTKTLTDTLTLSQGKKVRYIIDGILNTDYSERNLITNYVEIEGDYINIKSNEVAFSIETEDNNLDNESQETDPSNNPIGDNSLNSISGVAFEDINNNGMRDANEPYLSGMSVLLMDESTGTIALDSNNKKMETITTSEGAYQFENLVNGKYTVLFKFDLTNYNVAEYKKSGIDETNNSDVVYKDISLNNGSVSPYASTETLALSGESLYNIDAGFIKKKKFDLKLDKTITKTIVKNDEGTKQMSYDGTKLSKVEIRAKQLANTTVIVEYTISVTNEGELAGFASEIIDYIPDGLKFSSDMNASWYQGMDGYLLNRELTNSIIQPGETKAVKLTLSKAMTASNTGTAINVAEINKTSNQTSSEDIDSIPGNKDEKEDDISSAELIISVGTGRVLMNTIIIFISIIIIGLVIFFINKKILNNKKEIV